MLSVYVNPPSNSPQECTFLGQSAKDNQIRPNPPALVYRAQP